MLPITKRKIEIECRSKEECEKICERLHNQLKENLDYIFENIQVEHIKYENKILILVNKDVENIPMFII